MSKSKDGSDTSDFSITLEAPAPPDTPLTSVGALLGDSNGQDLAKLAIVEGLLGLITKELNYHEFLLEILISVLKVLKSEAGSILEVNHDSNTLFFRAVAGTASDKLMDYTVPVGTGIVGHCAANRQTIVVNDIKEEPRYLKTMEDAVGFRARNLVALPIIIRGKIFGVLELLNRVGEENYSPTDVELMNYATDKIAHAIEARLMISSTGQAKKKAA